MTLTQTLITLIVTKLRNITLKTRIINKIQGAKTNLKINLITKVGMASSSNRRAKVVSGMKIPCREATTALSNTIQARRVKRQ